MECVCDHLSYWAKIQGHCAISFFSQSKTKRGNVLFCWFMLLTKIKKEGEWSQRGLQHPPTTTRWLTCSGWGWGSPSQLWSCFVPPRESCPPHWSRWWTPPSHLHRHQPERPCLLGSAGGKRRVKREKKNCTILYWWRYVNSLTKANICFQHYCVPVQKAETMKKCFGEFGMEFFF